MDGTPRSGHLKLAEGQRIDLALDLRDSVPVGSPLTAADAEIEEWERRLAEHDTDPASAISWEEARAELRDRFGA